MSTNRSSSRKKAPSTAAAGAAGAAAAAGGAAPAAASHGSAPRRAIAKVPSLHAIKKLVPAEVSALVDVKKLLETNEHSWILQIVDKETHADGVMKMLRKRNKEHTYGIDEEVLQDIVVSSMIRSPSIVTSYSAGYDAESNYGYIVMERAPRDLRVALTEEMGGGTSMEKNHIKLRMQWLFDVLLGVKVMHDNDLMHLDLKLYNILQVGDRMKLCDFGSTKWKGAMRRLGTHFTPSYGSPELYCESVKYNERADVWSIGVMMCRIFFGAHPFAAETPTEIWEKMLETLGLPDADFAAATSRGKCPLTAEQLKRIGKGQPQISKMLDRKVLVDVDERKKFQAYYGDMYDDIWDLIARCWRYNPDERISVSAMMLHPLFVKEGRAGMLLAAQRAQAAVPVVPIVRDRTVGDFLPEFALEDMLTSDALDEDLIEFILPIARKLHTKLKDKQDAGEWMNPETQAACILLACKLASASADVVQQLRTQMIPAALNVAQGPHTDATRPADIDQHTSYMDASLDLELRVAQILQFQLLV
jgi:serine/threonine protein kinase